jgi:hypothetical protein
MNLKSCTGAFFRAWNKLGKHVMILLVIWLTLIFSPNFYTALAADIYGPACGVAVIDGIANPAEWSGASTKTFQMVNPANQQVLEATIRVRNDKDFLYLGLTINDDEFTTQAQFLAEGSLNHFELKHPLCSGDLLDFCLHPGDIVGFRLEYLDAGAGGTFDGSYFYPGSNNTSLADIVIADCSVIYLPHISK